MSVKGKCPVCKKTAQTLTEHHVVEAPDENGKVHSIHLCEECHLQQERYRNYLKSECGIDIDNSGLQE